MRVTVKSTPAAAYSIVPGQSVSHLAPAATIQAATSDVSTGPNAPPSVPQPQISAQGGTTLTPQTVATAPGGVTSSAAAAPGASPEIPLPNASGDAPQSQDGSASFAPLVGTSFSTPSAGGSTGLTEEILAAPVAVAGNAAAATEAKAIPVGDALVAQPSTPQGLVQAQENTAPTAAQAVRQTVQPSPIDQIKVQLSKSLKDGADTLSIQLHPEDLGRVEVKLEMQNGQVKATVTADRPETLQLLKNDAGSLQQSLNNAGLGTDANSLSFQLRGEQQQQQRQSAENAAGRPADRASELPDDETASAALAATALARSGNSNGGIDINV